MAQSVVGSLVSLWRYPVKSMMGEELNATEVTENGLWGDRAYALVDAETGKIISAKLPRKWGILFDCRAALNSPSQVKITLPDGASIMGDAADINRVLSRTFGREVKLETVAPETPSIEMYTPDNEVRLKITEPCPRCVMTTMPQGELPKDIEILHTAVKHNGSHIGIYANVLQGGTIRRGDVVAITV